MQLKTIVCGGPKVLVFWLRLVELIGLLFCFLDIGFVVVEIFSCNGFPCCCFFFSFFFLISLGSQRN